MTSLRRLVGPEHDSVEVAELRVLGTDDPPRTRPHGCVNTAAIRGNLDNASGRANEGDTESSRICVFNGRGL